MYILVFVCIYTYAFYTYADQSPERTSSTFWLAALVISHPREQRQQKAGAS
jgi:hypothetical protein